MNLAHVLESRVSIVHIIRNNDSRAIITLVKLQM